MHYFNSSGEGERLESRNKKNYAVKNGLNRRQLFAMVGNDINITLLVKSEDLS
jgi:hypothetical protein